MLEHLLGLESAGVTRASRQGDKEQQALSAAIRAGHSEVSGVRVGISAGGNDKYRAGSRI